MGVTTKVEITPAQAAELTQLLDRYLPNVSVWAFGSRVKGTARAHSDLDLAIFSPPEQEHAFYALREALEESSLPFRVDLLAWYAIPDSFKANIKQHYAVIREGDNKTRAQAEEDTRQHQQGKK